MLGLLVLFKLAIAFFVPDTPAWVVASAARAEFMHEMEEHQRHDDEKAGGRPMQVAGARVLARAPHAQRRRHA